MIHARGLAQGGALARDCEGIAQPSQLLARIDLDAIGDDDVQVQYRSNNSTCAVLPSRRFRQLAQERNRPSTSYPAIEATFPNLREGSGGANRLLLLCQHADPVQSPVGTGAVGAVRELPRAPEKAASQRRVRLLTKHY